MGWKAWDAYDSEARERWKAARWRYRWFAIALLAAIFWYICNLWFTSVG
jgi:hypothetical protein